MLKLLRNLKTTEWGIGIVAFAFILIQVWLDLAMPEYMAEITELVQTEAANTGTILVAGGKMLACAFGSLIAAVMTAICSARIATNFGASLRDKLFRKVQSFSIEEIGRFSTSSLITRSTNDVTQVQTLIIMGMIMLIKAPITAAWAIYKILGKADEWTITTALAVVVLVVVVLICLKLSIPKFKKIQKLTDDVNRVTRENLTGIRIIRAYNAEQYQEDKFENANAALTAANLFTQRTMTFLMPSIQIVLNGLTLGIYWVGAVLIGAASLASKITLFSDMVVFSQYAIQVVMSFMLLVMIFMMLPRASVSAKRIREVLEIETSITDGEKNTSEPGRVGEIEFNDVSFRYPDAEEYVLDRVSFSVKKGETVALIGSTGCGKSTVVNLIPRFYDVSAGAVLVDGVDVREYSQKTLRNKIAYVSQKAFIFAGSVRSNIMFGDNPKDSSDNQDLKTAAKIAQASEFIERMEDNYDGYVAQGGTNLSGGQRQRLSIARAIARKPEIFIFDDSFSALDYKTEKLLREKLVEECRGATQIIVAQRISTIRDADKIIVLEQGRIVGQGRHEELLGNCEVYQQIALSQLSQEELA